MPFKFSFRVDSTAITVPYAPIADHIRHNHGFVDLRGRPDKAEAIAEGCDSPALRRLLVRTAKIGAMIFTLGCDLGSHREPTQVPARRREVAGGYVQFASVHYDKVEGESYTSFANALVGFVKVRAGEDFWEINLVGKWVNFQIEGSPKGIHPSLWVWFFAAAQDQFTAIQSRERLIEVIDEAITQQAALEFLVAR